MFMLDIIKKFRNSPKRTVITISMEDCVSINRQGDLRKAKKAYMEQKNGTNKGEKVSFANPALEEFSCECESENATFICDDGTDKATTGCGCGDTRYAFDVCEDIRAEYCGEKGACSDVVKGKVRDKNEYADRGACKEKGIYLTYPCCKMELKGGVRAKKTVRFLLCDAVVVMMGACAIKCALTKLMKLK